MQFNVEKKWGEKKKKGKKEGERSGQKTSAFGLQSQRESASTLMYIWKPLMHLIFAVTASQMSEMGIFDLFVISLWLLH